ncbi:MAG: Cof-type HAD-IIB family hydrolase, partial [Blautia sp.]
MVKENEMIKMVASDLDGTLLRDGAQKLNEELFVLIR